MHGTQILSQGMGLMEWTMAYMLVLFLASVPSLNSPLPREYAMAGFPTHPLRIFRAHGTIRHQVVPATSRRFGR